MSITGNNAIKKLGKASGGSFITGASAENNKFVPPI